MLSKLTMASYSKNKLYKIPPTLLVSSIAITYIGIHLSIPQILTVAFYAQTELCAGDVRANRTDRIPAPKGLAYVDSMMQRLRAVRAICLCLNTGFSTGPARWPWTSYLISECL